MGTISPSAASSFEALYASNVDGYLRYLHGVLGNQNGARVEAEDALQDAMLQAYERWEEISSADPGDGERRVYRLLRDAASEALRREHGRRTRRGRPGVLSYDFGSLDAEEEDLAPHERDLTVAVLGQMARDITDTVQDRGERRAVLNRAVLLAGLRALTEREAVVLIAVEHQGWDQLGLAKQLGITPAQVHVSLFNARKLFYGIVRHTLGVDVGEEERSRLHAYLAGELRGREQRLARRHLRGCQSCQTLVREQKAFIGRAHQILSPLPFLLGAGLLTGRVAKSAAATTGAGAASGAGSAAGRGLLAQAGSGKVLGVTVAMLGTGFGVAAWLSIPTAADPVVETGTSAITIPKGEAARRSTLTVNNPSTAKKSKTSTKTKAKSKHHATTTSSHPKKKKTQESNAAADPVAPTGQTPPPASPQQPGSTPAATDNSPATGSNSSGGGGSSGGAGQSSGGGEFFGG